MTPDSEYPFVLGTAGHIDHGKTALVRALTGVDCDRLDEEKRRGITIEPGFAPLVLPDGKTVSIVDVPGHERFVRQMTAGAAGIDAAVLVIAANEGVMPQTREHLDILNLLGVKSGIVALTKKDTADDGTLELAAAEAADITRGTCLEGAAVVPVSALTGEGIPRLLDEITKIIEKIPPRSGFGAFFMPIDRVFSKKGLGSVVTGTSYQGRIAAGDEVDILPSGVTGKARSLQTHGASVESAGAGQRLAVNLAGVPQENLGRGNVVCEKGAFIVTDCMDVMLETLPSAPRGITHWQRVRLHIGTEDIVARVSLLDMEDGAKDRGIMPGNRRPAQLLPESKIAAAAGQRFVIRFYSPLLTIGGGRVMLPNARAAKGRAERAEKAAIIGRLFGEFDAVPLLAAIIRDKGVINEADLFSFSQMSRNVFDENLAVMNAALKRYDIFEFGNPRNYVPNDVFEKLSVAVLRSLKEFHAKFPERAGIEIEKLRAMPNTAAGTLSASDFKAFLELMISKGAPAEVVTVQGKTCCKLAEFNRSPDKNITALAARVIGESAARGFNLIKVSELEQNLKVSPQDMKRAITYLRENGDLALIEGELLFPLETRTALLKLLASMEDITVASLRDAASLNRKQSLALLDFLDSLGETKRVGDKRILTRYT